MHGIVRYSQNTFASYRAAAKRDASNSASPSFTARSCRTGTGWGAAHWFQRRESQSQAHVHSAAVAAVRRTVVALPDSMPSDGTLGVAVGGDALA